MPVLYIYFLCIYSAAAQINLISAVFFLFLAYVSFPYMIVGRSI